MSLLPTSGDTIIHDGQFTNAQNIYNYNLTGIAELHPWQILEKNTALDALFDSDARFDPPKCHPDTRKAVLDHIHRWATDIESSPVMWIRGAAGAGKSAIAQTLAERWDEAHILAASFYFSRTVGGRNEKKYLIGTLAHQIATNIPGTRSHIENAIRQTPKIFERNLRTQMRQLIINPLLSLSKGAVGITARVVIIDGLDECCIDYPNQDHEQQQKELLEAIHLAVTQNGFPLRFLIASRPERQIREIFEYGILKPALSLKTILDDTTNPAADIELYLRCKLDEIRQLHLYLGPSWPSEEVISQLVAKSSGHFIYAAVVVRYLGSPRANPDASLQALLGLSPVEDNNYPFAELDALYTHILRGVAQKSLPMVMDVFSLMTDDNEDSWSLFKDVKEMSPLYISKYLFIPLGELYTYLVDLHSILDIPPANESATVPISFLHASFSEFLTQLSRSVDFYVDKERTISRKISLSIRHLFVQILSPRGGEKEQYRPAGFAFQTADLLELERNRDQHTLAALKALLNRDEHEFLQYIRQEGLDIHGTKRQSIAIILYLYRGAFADSSESEPLVLAILKDHYGDEFIPLVDPLRYEWSAFDTNRVDWADSDEVTCPSPSGHEELSKNLPPPNTLLPNTNGEQSEDSSSTQQSIGISPELQLIKRRSGFRKRIADLISGSSKGKQKS